MPSSSQSQAAKIGQSFKVSHSAVFHHERLRPIAGVTGVIRYVFANINMVVVEFPGGAKHHLLLTMGTIGEPIQEPAAECPSDAIVEKIEAYIGPLRRFGVSLPLPPAECSPNARPDRFSKAEAIKRYRETCGRLYIEAGIPPLRTPIRIDLAFYLWRPPLGVPVQAWGGLYDPKSFAYPRDRDNARSCAKAAQDALQDAGVIVADSARNVLSGETIILSRAAEHHGETKLVLSIEEVASE